MVKTRSFQSESESSTMASATVYKSLQPAAQDEGESSSTSPVTVVTQSKKTTHKTISHKKASAAKATRHQRHPLARVPKTDLIKGTSHIHFHENIRVSKSNKKGRSGKQSPTKDNDNVPEVVKMATGTLYIYRGNNRRVVFVRNK